MDRSCYIINFYLGVRRGDYKFQNKLNTFDYIKKQIETLENYKHALSKIVFSFNIVPNHYNLLTDVIKIIPKFIQGAEVDIIIRDNIGMSYRAWVEAYVKYKDMYEYFIFNEDDYFFIQNNWDEYLINKFNSYNDCGYFCCWVREPHPNDDYKKFAAFAAGVSSNTVLSTIIDKLIKLPIVDNYHKDLQNDFSFLFIQNGYNLYDIRDDYRFQFFVPYGEHDIWRLFWWNEKDLIVPMFNYVIDYHQWLMFNSLEYTKDYKLTTKEEALWCYNQQKEYVEIKR